MRHYSNPKTSLDKKNAPLRTITKILSQVDDHFKAQRLVLLECGHTALSNAPLHHKARCLKCKLNLPPSPLSTP